MKLPSWRRITKSDYPDLPEWFEEIADSLNRHLELITEALQTGLTIEENLRAEVRQLAVANGVWTPVEFQVLRRNAKDAILTASSYHGERDFDWRMSETRMLTGEIRIVWAVPPPANPTVRVVFLG